MYIVKAAAFCCFFASGLAAAESVDPTLPIDGMPPPPGLAGEALQERLPAGVSMIVIRGSQAFALMDGRYVQVGDTVGAAKVTAIGRNHVELSGPGGTVRHYLAGYGQPAGSVK